MFFVELSSHFQANCNKNIVEVHEQSPDFPGWNTALVHQIKAIAVRSFLQQTAASFNHLQTSITLHPKTTAIFSN